MGYAIPIATQQHGSGMPVYAGQRRQMGGNLFGTIARFALPLLKKLWPVFRNLGKRAGKAALNVGAGLATDLITGQARHIPANFRKRGREEVNNISRDYIGQDIIRTRGDDGDNMGNEQGGSGYRRQRYPAKRAKAINMNKNKKKQATKKRCQGPLKKQNLV